jgi:ATP-dependent RNA helicase DDX3X
MVQNIALCGYEHPTPIQAYTIPAVLQGKDVIATAQTGMANEILTKSAF